MSGSYWWYQFHKEGKDWDSIQPDLEFDKVKPRLKGTILNCIFWLRGLFFAGDEHGFLKEGVKTYQMAPMSPDACWLANFFSVFESIVYAVGYIIAD